LEQLAISYPSSGEKDIVPRNEIICRKDSFQVKAARLGSFSLCIATGLEDSLYLATNTFHGTGCDYTLWCSTDSHKHIDTSSLSSSFNCTSHITITDEFDSRAAGSDFFNKLVVSRSV
jgi:hypothetical protein